MSLRPKRSAAPRRPRSSLRVSPSALGIEFSEEGGDGEVFDILAGDSELIGPIADFRPEVVGISVEEGFLHVAKDAAVVDHAVDGFAAGDGVGDAVEELAFAADDIDLGVLEGFADDDGLLLRDLAVDIDSGEFDGLFLVEPELEFLVLLSGFFEEFHGIGFLLDRIRIGETLGAKDFRFAHSDGGGFLGDGVGEFDFRRRFLGGGGLLGFGADDTFLGAEFGGGFRGFGSFGDIVGLFVRFEAGGFLVGFGDFGGADELVLGVGLGEGDFDLFLAVGTGEGFGILDALLLDDDGFFERRRGP